MLPPLDSSTPEKSNVKVTKSDTPSFKSVLPKGAKYAGKGKMSLSPTRSLKIIHRGKSLSPGGRGRGIRKVISVVFWMFKICLSVVFWIFKICLGVVFWIFKICLGVVFWIFKIFLSVVLWIFKIFLSVVYWIFKFVLSVVIWIFKNVLSVVIWIYLKMFDGHPV